MNALGLRFVGVGKRVGASENLARAAESGEIDGRRVALRKVQVSPAATNSAFIMMRPTRPLPSA